MAVAATPFVRPEPARAEPSVTCPSCGREIPLTQALRADIEASVKREYEAALALRERDYERQLQQAMRAAEADAAARAERRLAEKTADLTDQLLEQSAALDEARRQERDLRKRERDLEARKADLELTVERTLDAERARLVAEAQARMSDDHRLKDAEKERQLADMRRQIEDLKRRADQGSQQLQGEAGEDELESILRECFPMDEIANVGQGVRGADLHQVVADSRGARAGFVLWECKNAKHWSDAWIPKLKDDQRACRADVAVLVTATLPGDCSRFALVDGVVVTDFASAGPVATLIRAQLLQLAHARVAAATKDEKLELLYRYLSGVEFRQRVEAVVEAFATMRAELDQERRAAQRQWARRSKQIDAVTLNIAGMYGDLQGLVALPAIRSLELPAGEEPR